MGDCEPIDPRRDTSFRRRIRWKIRKRRAIRAASAKKPRITITAIAQWGKGDDELLPFCNPDPPCPELSVVGTPLIVVTIEESVGLIVVAVADDKDDRDDNEAATDEEEAAAADEDEDIEAKTEFAKVVSKCNIDVRFPAFECYNDLRMAVKVDCGGI